MRIKFFKPAFLFIMSIGLMQVSFAMQIKPVNDNETIQAYVSIKGITRIAVLNDRIEDVRGIDGAYQIKTDTNQGAVFIQPTADYQKKPFTVFIATEQNHNYVLRLTPRNQNADTILLKPRNADNPMAMHWETSSPYTEMVTLLIKDMVNQTSPEGYAVDALVNVKKHHFNVSFDIKPIKIYQGAYLQGTIYSITNRTAQTILLNEQPFYQTGIRAIAFAQETLAPHGQTLLYVVRSNHE